MKVTTTLHAKNEEGLYGFAVMMHLKPGEKRPSYADALEAFTFAGVEATAKVVAVVAVAPIGQHTNG